MLLKDTRSFATVRWTQTGFRRAHGSEKPGTTMRNLFGQVDGTTNPSPDGDDFAQLVWSTDGWLAGGTSLVLRRTRMNLDKWDRLDHSGREQPVGRTLSNGAPLAGVNEHDEPDFDAKTSIGFPVIPEFSHMRRARSENTAERIYRRSYNYDHAPSGADICNSGLLFVSYQADVMKKFVRSNAVSMNSTFSMSGPPPSVPRFSRYHLGAPKAVTSATPFSHDSLSACLIGAHRTAHSSPEPDCPLLQASAWTLPEETCN